MTGALFEIAETLGDLYKDRAELNMAHWRNERDTTDRQVEITPAGDDFAALGKNEAARQAALDKILADDPMLDALARDLAEITGELETVNARIEGMEAERRAYEWRIRQALAEALIGKNIYVNGRGDRVEAAFDDAMMAASDQAVTEPLLIAEEDYLSTVPPETPEPPDVAGDAVFDE